MDFVKILEAEKNRINAMSGNWGTGTRNRLVKLLEDNDIFISDSLFDLLLFNIQDLIIQDNKIGLVWRGNQSKKVIKVLLDNQEIIKENYNHIMCL